MEFEIPGAELDEWLAELKPYQQNTMKQLLCSFEPAMASDGITSYGLCLLQNEARHRHQLISLADILLD